MPSPSSLAPRSPPSSPRSAMSRTGSATALWMMDHLKRPLLIEGAAGVGKTEVAKALALVHGSELIRMQCYEGSTPIRRSTNGTTSASFSRIKAREGSGASVAETKRNIFSEDYLLERPLLAAHPPREAARSARR